MADESYQERTEKATPKRRQEARDKGQVARSRDLSSALVLLAGVLGLTLWGPAIWRRFIGVLEASLSSSRASLDMARVPSLFQAQALTLAGVLVPLLLALSAAAFAGNFLQVGQVFSGTAVTPDLSRIQLLSGLKRLFSLNSLMELGKSLAKVLLVGLTAYLALDKELPRLLPLLTMDPVQIPAYLGDAALRLATPVILVLLALGGFDYLYQRYRYEKGLRMSRQEVRDELRQTEGDPKIKARVRSLMRQMASKRMMAEVSKADVVITNPTHLAVALKYDPDTMTAPQVVAKGRGFVAQKIKDLAVAHKVPLMENRNLAQALFRLVEVGATIPASLYLAVAEVLAFIYRLRAGSKP